LNRVDLPTLGRPTRAMVGFIGFLSVSGCLNAGSGGEQVFQLVAETRG